MGRDTNIAWTKSTLNLAWGCTKVSQECKNCYMYRLSAQFGQDPTVVRITKAGSTPKATDAAIRKMHELVFVNSMSDTVHKDIPDDVLENWFAAFAAHPEKQFQILTKRPERAAKYFETRVVPDNCWIGTSVGMASAKTRIDELRQIDDCIRFLSCEPLIEDLGELDLRRINWVIIGGESDPKAPRPMDPAWAERIIAQCKVNGVKVFFKQMGGVGGDGAGGDLINGRRIQEMPDYEAGHAHPH